MNKRANIAIMALTVLALSACHKDYDKGQLVLLAEGMQGTKLAVAGNASHWATGDQVRINSEEATVSIDRSNGTATVSSASTFSAPFYGVYPAGIYSSNSGASYTLNLPRTYTYATTDDDGTTRQNLQSPMVAYAESGNQLLFKHVTAAVGVQVVNYYGFTIEVDSIVVSSDSYRLNGETSVALAASISVAPVAHSAEGDNSVVMKFNGGATLQILAGDSATVQLPVLPVGAGNHFTVQTYVHKVDQAAVAKCYEKTQSTGGALGRASIGYARFTTGGLFSVAADRKVIISQGNLQYQASSGTWRFATEQYGFIGDAAGNNTFDDSRATQSAWIDLFGWGTSGWQNTGSDTIIYYRPYDYQSTRSSQNAYGYGPRHKENYSYSYTYDLTGDYANSDWGIYNAISNGGNVAGRWRTPTGGSGSEWEYLLSTRTASTIGSTSNARFVKVSINGTYGAIIFPDEYEHPTRASSINGSDINNTIYISWTNVQVITYEDWAKMEAEGAVFLPAAGYRSALTTSTSTTPTYTANTSIYWSASYNDNYSAKSISVASRLQSVSTATRAQGNCVRLVHDVE